MKYECPVCGRQYTEDQEWEHEVCEELDVRSHNGELPVEEA